MSRLKNRYDFMAGVYFEGELYFNKYSLMLDFYTLGLAQDQNIAMDRISYFIYDIVTRSIFICEDDVDKIKLLTKAGTPVLTVPNPGPFDPVVLAVLATKINSILDDVIVVSEAEITSAISGPLIYVWDPADDDDEIHSLVDAEDATRWWASTNPRFGSYPADTDVDGYEDEHPFPLTWEMIDLDWTDEEDINEGDAKFIVDVITEPGGKKGSGTVIKADFTGEKPVVKPKPKPKPKPKK